MEKVNIPANVVDARNLIITDDVLAGVSGYKNQQLVAEWEYQVVPQFTFTGQLWYEITQLKALYDLPEEETKNIVWGAGWKYTREVTTVLSTDIRT